MMRLIESITKIVSIFLRPNQLYQWMSRHRLLINYNFNGCVYYVKKVALLEV